MITQRFVNTRSTYSILAALCLLLVGMPGGLHAQIYSGEADYIDSVYYPTADTTDPLFVFYQSEGALKEGTLSADAPAAGNFTFEWSKYDPDTDSYGIIQTDNNAGSSTVTGLTDGGYRVRIYNGVDVDTLFRAWVMLDNFTVANEKTGDDRIKPYKYTCAFLVLTGMVEVDTFYYYDPVSHEQILLENGYTFEWTSDNPELFIPNATTVLDPNTTYAPPVEDTWYILTATDSLGMTERDSVFYETIHTRAEFTMEYWDKINDVWDPSLTGAFSTETGSLDAPLRVKFLNDSKNGYQFDWIFVDSLDESTKEYETSYDLEYEPEYTYMRADETYYPYLVSISEEGCIDTFKYDEGIEVVASQLSIPNVFSPNGDGVNDVFIFKHQSLKKCRVTIVDRFGKVVYKRKIDDIYEWEGWRGTVRNTDREAPEGQYYFVVEALGYDGEEYKDPNILEQRKLRNEQDPQGGGGTGNGDDEEGTSTNLFTGWVYLYRDIGSNF